MGFDIDKATTKGNPTFKFGSIGDGFVGVITDVADGVTGKNDKGEDETYIVLQVEISKAKGGDREDKDSPTTDVPAGETRSLWLRYEVAGRAGYTALTRTIAAAVKEAGSKAIEVGAELTVKHTELGPKQDDPKKSRAKLYTAAYKAPVKASSVALDDF